MAGPWFAVHESGGDWKKVDTIWVSNGNSTAIATCEIKVRLEEASDEE